LGFEKNEFRNQKTMNQTEPDLSARVIGAAIRVHQELGPGFLESLYEKALCLELADSGLRYQCQLLVPVTYRQQVIGEHRLGLLIEHQIVVELKTVTAFEPVHFATLRSYLKAANCELGLLLNFAATKLEIKRVDREWHSRSN
jgi:GxxExxY protein